MGARATSNGTSTLDAPVDMTEETTDVLLALLAALEVPGSIHRGLASSVAHSARVLLGAGDVAVSSRRPAA